MTEEKIEIDPSTVVHDLLENYPELEEKLITLAPPFEKLKNPFLRKSVAKVATLKHISLVGNIPLKELIDRLRETVGQPRLDETFVDEDYFSDEPDWFSADKVAVSVNESEIDNPNEMTLNAILKEARNVEKGNIIELITTFLPAPGIDLLKSKGFLVWTKKEDGGLIKSYFLKN
jgi:hypothetical protein